jgi:hypothetical protein
MFSLIFNFNFSSNFSKFLHKSQKYLLRYFLIFSHLLWVGPNSDKTLSLVDVQSNSNVIFCLPKNKIFYSSKNSLKSWHSFFYSCLSTKLFFLLLFSCLQIFIFWPKEKNCISLEIEIVLLQFTWPGWLFLSFNPLDVNFLVLP